MSFHSTDQMEKRTNAEPTASNAILQRKSGCDQHTFDNAECTDLHSSEQVFNPVSIGTFAASLFGYDFSRVPAHTDMVHQTLPLLRTQPMIQRHPRNGDAGLTPCATCTEEESTPISAPAEPVAEAISPPPESTPTPTTAEPEVESAAPGETTAPALLVEDSAAELAPGQMRKSEFLNQLRAEVNRAAEAAMAGTGRTTRDCPYLNFWFGYYSLRDSTYIERAIHRYAPETASVTTARGYIPIIAGRVRRAVDTWVRTGEVTGVPEGVPTTVPGASGGSGGGGATASTGPVMRKAREGGARAADNPQAIQAELGEGRPLDGGVRSRMESAFGMDFSHVRTHTDTTAAGLSNRLNARAFTVGEHVAFGSEEYRPGTLVGDALIAHEMAHVVQQRNASASVAPMQTGSSNYNMLENDADKSALDVVASLWAKSKGTLSDLAKNAVPRLTSGLRLQACKSERQIEIERLAKLQYGLLEKKRKEKEKKERKEANKARKKAGIKSPKTPKIEVKIDDVLKEEVKERAFTTHPATAWTSLSKTDQANWEKRAKAAWKKIVASVKGTELEKVIKGKSFKFDPKTALTNGWYAWEDKKTLYVGMAWVKSVEADPKNEWDTLAHELGGHYEYGRTYAGEIMSEVLELMPKAEREKWRKGKNWQKLFEAFQYSETEIYASLRQLRYREPVSGPKPKAGRSIHPYKNIANHLKKIKQAFHPEVAKAILKELKRRIDKSSEILDRDKKYYMEEVKKFFGYTL